jgi:hypothetical protein
MSAADFYVYFRLTLNSSVPWRVSQRSPTIVPQSLKNSVIASSSIQYDKFPAYSFLQSGGFAVFWRLAGFWLAAAPLDSLGGQTSPGRGGQ